MAKKGPGRPTGGIRIQPNHTIPVSDKLFLEALREILDVNVYNNLLKLPEQSRQILIGDIKSRLYKVAGSTDVDPTTIYLGEYSDRRGVQVTFDFEMLAKDPVKYLSSLPKSYIQGIINQNDIEGEIELKTVQELLTQGDTLKSKSYFQQKGNNVQLLQDRAVTVTGRGTQIVKGADGIDGIQIYKDYSDSVIKWADGVQSMGDRAKGRAAVRTNLLKLLAQEAALKNGWTPGAPGKDEGDILQDFISGLPAGSAAEFKRAYGDLPSNPKLLGLYTKEIAKNATGEVLSLEGILSHADAKFSTHPIGGVRTVLNSYSVSNRLGKLTGPFAFNADLKKFLLDKIAPNDTVAKTWGFSSADAVKKMLDSYYGDPTLNMGALGNYARDPLFPKLFKTSATDVFTRDDVVKFEKMLKEISDTTGAIQTEITDTFLSRARYNGYKVIDEIVGNLPPTVSVPERTKMRNRMRGAVNWMDYVEVRSDMESQEEFFTAVGKGNVWKAYFYKGSYNKWMPARIQKISDQILAKPIPGLGYSVNNYLDTWVRRRDSVLMKMGFSGLDTEKRWLLSVQKQVVLRQSDFNSVFWEQTKGKPFIMLRDRTLLEPGPAANLSFSKIFKDNIAWDDLGIKSNNFKSNFFNFRTASITINAGDYKMLPGFFESVYELAKTTPGVTDVMLEGMFQSLAANPSLIDTDPMFAALRASPSFAKYKDSILKFFNQAKKAGINEKEYLSFALLLKQKGLISEAGPGKFALVRYTPFLNTIAERLSGIQTYIYEFVGEKLLTNTLFKAPGGALFKSIWSAYNPRFGGLGMAEKLINFTKTTLFGRTWNFIANSAIGKLVWAGLTKILPAFLTSATAGTAYLAIVINKVMMAIGRSFLHILRGRFNLIGKEFYSILDDLVVKPIKFIMNTGAKIIIYTLVVVAFIVVAASAFVIQTLSPKIPDGTGGGVNNLQYYVNVDGQVCAKFASSAMVTADFRNSVDGDLFYSYGVSDCFGGRTWKNAAGKEEKEMHTGLDILMGMGTSVNSNLTKDAEVVIAGWDTSGYGNLVVIKEVINDIPYYFYFGHLSEINVNPGDTVKPGQLLGLSGSTGRSTGPHLHYEVRVGSKSTTSSGAATVVNTCSVLKCPERCLKNVQSEDGEMCFGPAPQQ